MWTRRCILAGLILGSFCLSGLCLARQNAQPHLDQVAIYERPDRNLKAIGMLKKGRVVSISSQMLRDPEGSYWYKVQSSRGIFGYVLANEISTLQLKKELIDAGIGNQVEPVQDGDVSWSFLIRAMGLGGVDTLSQSFLLGGEVEVSYCLPLESKGHLHHLISLGPSFFLLGSDLILTGTLTYRFFEESRWQPEFRFSAGRGMVSNQWMGGLNFGLGYPFSSPHKTHLSGYLELGTLSPVGWSTFLVYGSMGLGVHL